jgi:hypothetical protein
VKENNRNIVANQYLAACQMAPRENPTGAIRVPAHGRWTEGTRIYKVSYLAGSFNPFEQYESRSTIILPNMVENENS